MRKLTPVQKKDKFLKYLLYISLVGLGVAAGIAIRHYHDIPMIEAINIIDIASLIVTIFLAIYIPGVFDRQMEVRQDKKELVEHRIEDLLELYRNINMTVQQGQVTDKEKLILRNSLDVAANRFGTITTLLEYLDLSGTFSGELADLKTLISRHARLLNGAAPEADGDYPDTVRREEEELYNKIDKEASLLVFRISDI